MYSSWPSTTMRISPGWSMVRSGAWCGRMPSSPLDARGHQHLYLASVDEAFAGDYFQLHFSHDRSYAAIFSAFSLASSMEPTM